MNLYIKAILTLCSLLSIARACSPGCLRCNINQVDCDICDFVTNLVPNGFGGCVSGAIIGCNKIGADGACTVCENGRYYDHNSRQCLLPTNIRAHCRVYSGPTTCLSCIQGAYLSNNTCILVTIPSQRVQDCLIYGSPSVCIQCRERFALNVVTGACDKTDHKDFCSNYRSNFCKRCNNENSLTNKNTYLINAFANNNIEQMRGLISRLRNGVTETVIDSFCIATSVPNCKIFQSHNKCSECNDNYFLTDEFTCQEYTIKNLTGCLFYNSLSSCEQCMNGYHKVGDICNVSTHVDFCGKYSSADDMCVECETGYYLSENSCTELVTVIANCSVYDIDSPNCAICEAGFVLNSAASECYELPSHCIESNVPVDALDITCSQCENGYYLLESLCILGNVEYCEVYAVDSETCIQCIDNFELIDGSCSERVKIIDKCEAYTLEGPTRCVTCSLNSMLFYEESICELNANIAFCANFSDKETCTACEPGYELVDNACNLIDVNENCLSKSLGNCNLCTENFELLDNICVPIPDQLTANCAIVDPESHGIKFTCLGCATDHVPIFDLESICVNSNTIIGTPIANCIKYDNIGDIPLCQLCALTHVLSISGDSCLETCPEGQVKYMGRLTIDQGTAVIENFAKCVNVIDLDDISDGCEVASHNLRGNDDVCLKCRAGFVPIEDCSLNTTFFDINNLDNFSEGQEFPVVSCVENANGSIFLPSTPLSESNCKYYHPRGNGFFCKQCDFGFTGTVYLHEGSGEYFVDCSEVVSGCDINVRLGSGLGDDYWIADMYNFNFSYGYTCHKCTNANQIPFIHLDVHGKLLPYELIAGTNIPSEATDLTGEVTVCREINDESLLVSTEELAIFPSNCALGLIVVNLELSMISDEPSLRCLACKDGYLPTYDQTGFYIESCDEIADCESNDENGWVNGCKTCVEYYTKTRDNDGKINPNSCSSEVISLNCRLYDDVTTKCVHCERGYYLDADGYCTNLDIPYCANYVQPSTPTFILNNDSINYSYAYYFGATGSDCYSCEDNYVAFTGVFDRFICAGHPNVSEQSADETSNYIDNCSRYYAYPDNTLFYCQICEEGFIINESHDTCYDNEEHIGCKILNDNAIECYECNEDYYLNSGACILKDVDNCAEYEIQNLVLVCKRCASGFIKDDNTCDQGTITGCKIYNVNGSCEECFEDRYLFLGYCLPIPQYTNCAVATLDVDQRKFMCTKCNQSSSINSGISLYDHTICLDRPVITACSAYDNTFECIECTSNYYRDNGICILRTNNFPNCRTLSSTDDTCINCNANFVKLNDQCAEVLNSIPFCVKYTGETTCGVCSRNRYVNDNQCILVPLVNRIINCDVYSDVSTCSECDDDYLLVGNECLLKVVTSCETYNSPYVCGTCPSGKILKTIQKDPQFIRDCIDPETPITNCAEVNASSKRCRVCNQNYYLQNKVCVPVDPIIPGCYRYSSATECSTCFPNYIRSYNGLECEINPELTALEPLCLDLQYNSKAACSACSAGYYFDSGRCVTCTVNKISDGCMYCDPSDNTKCLVCISGYYMNPLGACIASQAGLQDEDFDDIDGSVGFGNVLSVLVMLILALSR